MSRVDGQKARAPLFPTDYNPAIRHFVACLLGKSQVFTVNIDVLGVTDFLLPYLHQKYGARVDWEPTCLRSVHHSIGINGVPVQQYNCSTSTLSLSKLWVEMFEL